MTRARARAALVLLLLAAPGAARATRGRLALSLLAGGGYSSDALGGISDADGFGQLTPSARLDLALSPRWKLATAADLTYVQYLSSGAVWTESGGVELRHLGDDLELDLGAGVEHAAFDEPTSLDPTLVDSAVVSDTRAVTGSVLARLRTGALEWRLGGTGAARASTLQDVRAAGDGGDDVEGTLAGGVRLGLGGGAALSASYRFASASSDQPVLGATSHALFGLAAWTMGDLGAQLLVQLQTTRFDTSDQERLLRATASASYPLGETVEVEAVYAFGVHEVTPADPTLERTLYRHLIFLDLRWRWAEVTW